MSNIALLAMWLTLASLILCALPSSVSAAGSIQPFNDIYCNSPQANATLIPYTPDPATCQHEKDRAGIPIAFVYNCNYTDFQLTQWYNATQCDSTVIPTANIVASANLACAVAEYTDATDHYLFYAAVDCSASQSVVEADEAAKQSVVEAARTLLGSRHQRRQAKQAE